MDAEQLVAEELRRGAMLDVVAAFEDAVRSATAAPTGSAAELVALWSAAHLGIELVELVELVAEANTRRGPRGSA